MAKIELYYAIIVVEYQKVFINNYGQIVVITYRERGLFQA